MHGMSRVLNDAAAQHALAICDQSCKPLQAGFLPADTFLHNTLSTSLVHTPHCHSLAATGQCSCQAQLLLLAAASSCCACRHLLAALLPHQLLLALLPAAAAAAAPAASAAAAAHATCACISSLS
jgi:hypothetical protein